jgi:serine/threonine protein kinase
VLERAIPDTSADPARAERLLAEARPLLACAAPGLLRLLDAFLARSGPATGLFLVHAYTPGALLSALLSAARRRAEPVPVAVAVALLSELLLIVDDFHMLDRRHHLQLTPSHVLLGPAGLRLLCPRPSLLAWPGASGSEQHRGAFRYLAPEQTRGEPGSARTDVFQAAGLGWETLAGRPRVDAPDLLGLLGQIQFQRPGSLRPLRDDIPEDLDTLLRAALARHPRDRPGSARELRGLLLERARPAPWAVVLDWCHALGAEPFPGPEVFELHEGPHDDAPDSSSPPAHPTYRG